VNLGTQLIRIDSTTAFPSEVDTFLKTDSLRVSTNIIRFVRQSSCSAVRVFVKLHVLRWPTLQSMLIERYVPLQGAGLVLVVDVLVHEMLTRWWVMRAVMRNRTSSE
jgi:hypothetical protein